jgi:hypothetical protein
MQIIDLSEVMALGLFFAKGFVTKYCQPFWKN